MSIRYRVEGFTADASLTQMISEAASQITHSSPGAKISMTLSFDGSHYICKMNAVNKRGLFAGTTSDFDIAKAIRQCTDIVVDRLVRTVDLLAANSKKPVYSQFHLAGRV